LYTGTTLPGPSAVRYPRGNGPGEPARTEMTGLPVGKAALRREGRSGLVFLGFGSMVAVAGQLGEEFDATVVNMRYVKPLDEELVCRLASRARAIVTLEENVVAGGAGSAVAESLSRAGLCLPILHIGIPDRFIAHGSREDCLADAGLDLVSVRMRVQAWWRPGLRLAAEAN
ncbi:MAG: 1-deoxy-D-xylulose-5-phosphate synthase, partial [Proteobacteria bacterium]|nr:1-deoxy-D-xylulose-5-phosphate synthase [Pseudomonadota bacterium]